jgi:hypothetical protein
MDDKGREVPGKRGGHPGKPRKDTGCQPIYVGQPDNGREVPAKKGGQSGKRRQDTACQPIFVGQPQPAEKAKPALTREKPVSLGQGGDAPGGTQGTTSRKQR